MHKNAVNNDESDLPRAFGNSVPLTFITSDW